VTLAASPHSPTQTPTILQPSYPGAYVAVVFVRTFAGSARYLSNWIASSAHSTNARSSWLWAHRESWSQRRALSPTLAVERERSTSEQRSLRTHPLSPSVIWGRLERCCHYWWILFNDEQSGRTPLSIPFLLKMIFIRRSPSCLS
jgi:hypothetical protein